MLLRRSAALAMIVAMPFCSSVARADLIIVIPVNFSRLEPGTRFIGFGCKLLDERFALVGSGGVPFIPITGGRLETTLRIRVRRTELDAGRAASFACDAHVYGRRADGVAYRFQSGRVLRPEGWRGASWYWPGDTTNERLSYLQAEPGSRPQLIVEGVFTPEEALNLAAVEAAPPASECPCGCGAGGADGGSCSRDAGLPDWGVPSRWREGERRSEPAPPPPPPAKPSPRAIKPESRRLGLDGATSTPRAAPRLPGTGRVVRSGVTREVAALVFRGTGRIVLDR